MTIPNLISDYKKHVTVNKLKKAYNVLSVALTQSVEENGPITTWNVPDEHLFNRSVGDKYIFKYMNVEKQRIYEYGLRNLVGGGTVLASDDRMYYISNDGFVYWLVASCAKLSEDSATFCNWMHIGVDIDGHQKINRLGRDVFMFHVNFSNAKKPILYFSSKSAEEIKESGCFTGSKNYISNFYNGELCIDLIVNKGWNIDKDYPW